MQSICPPRLHVGVIMDGNGRWAQRRGLDRSQGHEAGVQAIARLLEAAPAQGVGVLTLYAFSADNWRRPKEEVAALMNLLRRYLREQTRKLADTGVRLSVIGRRDRLPPGLAGAIARAEKATAAGERLHLRIALDYSAREAILRAAIQAASLDTIDAEAFGRLVKADPDLRDVDLVIRTSGEQRLSDFLLWESAYAEFYFTDRLWPDFDSADLAAALAAFHGRERRFGGIEPSAVAA